MSGQRRALLRGARTLWLSAAALLLVTVPAAAEAGRAQAEQPFGVDDYFALTRVTDLALSPDGRMLAYVAETPSLSANKPVRRVHVGAVGNARGIALPAEVEQGRAFAWVPGHNRLAFLAEREGATQVLSFDPRSGAVTPHTRSADPVTSFAFAPDGASLAYITSGGARSGKSFYDQLRTSETGVLVDVRTVALQHFMDPNRHVTNGTDTESKVWVQPAGAERPARVAVPGGGYTLYWSPDSTRLSVEYRPRSMAEVFNPHISSVGIYRVGPRTFQVLADAYTSKDGRVTAFAGGQWRPGGNTLLVRRLVMSDLWVDSRFPSLAEVEAPAKGALDEAALAWHPIGEYSPYADSLIVPAPAAVFVPRVMSGTWGLSRVTRAGQLEPAKLCPTLSGDSQHFSFSADFQTVAFVSESLTRAPEVYIAEKGRCRQLTALNRGLDDVAMPNARSMTWTSKDGTQAHGWLLTPRERLPDGKPWPLVTYVHGGPVSGVVTDEFAAPFSRWPHPLAVLPSRGIAVFIPNYRGTGSYGRQFLSPSKIDKEPVEDIDSGIDHLVRRGVADPERLGIASHSHGSWLAPLVLARTKRFRAASFAEGISNVFVKYDLMPEMLNRATHDRVYGASPYDDPQRYIELSGDLSFKGSKAAVLAEAGAESVAPAMLGLVKAARRAGAPGEYVVYPRTGHGMTQPRLMREAAARNLDWFAYWLTGEVDPAPEKAAQYARWRALD